MNRYKVLSIVIPFIFAGIGYAYGLDRGYEKGKAEIRADQEQARLDVEKMGICQYAEHVTTKMCSVNH